MSRAKLHIVHRSRIFRECLATVLSRDSHFDVTEIDHTSPEFLSLDEKSNPDVVLIDAGLPDRLAVDFIHAIRQRHSRTKVLAIVSTTAQPEVAVDCILAGAHGCVLEESSLHDLQAAIEAIRDGKMFCSQGMIPGMFSQFAQLARDSHSRKKVKSAGLTLREIEILQLISGHLGNKQIAKKLSVSLYTVKNHVHNILEKLHLESRFEAVDYARQRHWISRDSKDTEEWQKSHSRRAEARKGH